MSIGADDRELETSRNQERPTVPSSRTAWWEARTYRARPILGGENEETIDLVHRRNGSEGDEDGLLINVLRLSKEIIFDMEGGRPTFSFVTFILDSETLLIKVGPSLQVSFDEEDLAAAWNQAKEVLAMAKLESVPVLANTEQVEPQLLKCYQELIENGFKTRLGGEDVQLKIADYMLPFGRPGNQLKMSEHWSAAEQELVRRVLLREMEGLQAAERTLLRLRTAIAQLTETLESEHSEHDLQRVLTKNPVLFGVDYRRIISKHRLGDDFEMDYALERFSGLVDLVEIEHSAHPLFNSKGDPRAPTGLKPEASCGFTLSVLLALNDFQILDGGRSA